METTIPSFAGLMAKSARQQDATAGGSARARSLSVLAFVGMEKMPWLVLEVEIERDG
jgi:hypothetical protein